MTSNLLVVDWDFFFPMPPANTQRAFELYDWGHAESHMYIGPIWHSRAASFLRNNMPLPDVNNDWHTWWQRFRFADESTLYFHESNAFAVNPRFANYIDGEVWLFDAHHDCGYNRSKSMRAIRTGTWTCEEWMIFYGRMVGVKNLHVRYPIHRPNAFEEEPRPYWSKLDRKFYDPEEETPEFDTVFVCRSGAWVPPWCDEKFERFLNLAPMYLEKVEGGLVERSFDLDEVKAYVKMLDEFFAQKGN